MLHKLLPLDKWPQVSSQSQSWYPQEWSPGWIPKCDCVQRLVCLEIFLFPDSKVTTQGYFYILHIYITFYITLHFTFVSHKLSKQGSVIFLEVENQNTFEQAKQILLQILLLLTCMRAQLDVRSTFLIIWQQVREKTQPLPTVDVFQGYHTRGSWIVSFEQQKFSLLLIQGLEV